MNSRLIFKVTKRACDIGVSAGVLAAALPVIGIAGLAVRLDSPGPALFRSRRVGQNGRSFDLLKLRTMAVAQDASAPQVTAGDDRRITRVGRWLRRSKLDEFPQLWNVLVGDVSLVGPRPEVQRYIDAYPEEYREILRIRPGLTDRATLEFVDEESLLAGQADPERYYVDQVMPRKLAQYLNYALTPSLLEDARILLETARRVIGRALAPSNLKRHCPPSGHGPR